MIALLLLASLLSSPCSASGQTQQCTGGLRRYQNYSLQPDCSDSNSTADEAGDSVTVATSSPLTCALITSQNATAAPAALVMMSSPTQNSISECRIVSASCQRFKLINKSESARRPTPLLVLVRSADSKAFLVFSIKAGSGVKSWQLFTGGLAASSSERLLLQSMDSPLLPDRFRSGLLDRMPSLLRALAFKQLIVCVYRPGGEVAVKLVFDVSGLGDSIDRENWFHWRHLVYSWPVPDLSSRSFDYFSIKGHDVYERRFFLSYRFQPCETETGFLLVFDRSSEGCPWLYSIRPEPRIVYNPSDSGLWNEGATDAEYLAIWAR